MFTGTTCISLPKKLQPWRGGVPRLWIFWGAALWERLIFCFASTSCLSSRWCG